MELARERFRAIFGHAHAEDRELVVADAPQDVPGIAGHEEQAARRFPEQMVGGLVADHEVDAPEGVDVDHDQGRITGLRVEHAQPDGRDVHERRGD